MIKIFLSIIFFMLTMLSFGNTIFLPNGAPKSINTPTGWVADNQTIFAGVGGTTNQSYYNTSDGSAVFGIGLGDMYKYLGVQLSAAATDLSEMNAWGGSFAVGKYLGYGLAASVGGINVVKDDKINTRSSYYFALSRAVQNIGRPKDEFFSFSKFHYTLGFGNGNFKHAAPEDKERNKGDHGTGFFANISYEIFENVNLIADWDGLNANTGIGVRPFKNYNIFFTVAAVQIFEGLTGDGPCLSGSVSAAYKF